MYAKGAEHPLREPCRELIAAVASEQLEATTTAGVIQEFVHVRARRRTRADAAALGRDYVDLLAPLIEVTADALRRGLALYDGTERLGAFDAVLAATAITSGATALVSADSAFAEVDGIAHVTPDSAGVASLLQSP